MSDKLVTLNQVECIRQMANAKRIGREAFQKALDNGTFAQILDNLKVNSSAIAPPQGARIHIVHIRVKQDRPWQEAVDAAGPNTLDEFNVRKVGDLYGPVGIEEIEEDLILLNYPSCDGDWNKALVWAKSVGLKSTSPREVFAVGEQHPKLHEQLGLNPVYVVATTECFFAGGRQACYVWWSDSVRETRLSWVDCFSSVAGGWFAFRK